MDKLKLQEEINALKNHGEHLESQLKLVNFDFSVLPDDVLLLLDKCAEIQAQSKLHELNLLYLREFYFINKREQIENNLIVGQQAAEVKKLKDSIAEAEKDVNMLEKFNKKCAKVIEEAAVHRNSVGIEGKFKNLQSRLENLKVPADFNIEAMIDKLETLERHTKGDTK